MLAAVRPLHGHTIFPALGMAILRYYRLRYLQKALEYTQAQKN